MFQAEESTYNFNMDSVAVSGFTKVSLNQQALTEFGRATELDRLAAAVGWDQRRSEQVLESPASERHPGFE